MSELKKKPVFTRRYDLEGNSLPRMLCHWVRIKTAIMGNYDSGPGLRCMMTLWLLHYLGRPLFALRTWLNNQYQMKARLRGLLNRLKQGAGRGDEQ